MSPHYLMLLPVAFFAGVLVAGSIFGLSSMFFDTVRALGRMAVAAVARTPVATPAIAVEAGKEPFAAESTAA